MKYLAFEIREQPTWAFLQKKLAKSIKKAYGCTVYSLKKQKNAPIVKESRLCNDKEGRQSTTSALLNDAKAFYWTTILCKEDKTELNTGQVTRTREDCASSLCNSYTGDDVKNCFTGVDMQIKR